MKTVLITGSEGFVGQHLWRELECTGYIVSGTTLNIPEKGLSENVYQCDILDKVALDDLIVKLKPDCIFHLAAQPKPGLSFEKPQLTFEINTIGTINLLESVRSTNEYIPRVIFVGTSEEHGVVDQEKLPITEETPLNPINPYAISKVANWYLAKEYVNSFGFDLVYITPFTHTGPGQLTGFLAPDVASQIVEIEKYNQEPVVITGDLSAKRDMVDVRDVARAYRLLMEKGSSGERYIVSSGESVPVKQIVDTLIGLAKIKIEHRIDPKRNRPSDIPDLYGSHAKLSRITGWEPEIPLEKTLSDLLDWYRTQA